MADAKDAQLVPAEQGGALASRPDFIPRGNTGTENITRDDIQMPRLAIAQGTSDQIKEDSPKYIDGLKLYHMFNSLTGAIYNRGPLHFSILRADPPRYIEFNPRDEGGGVKDMNVPPNDPRTQFTKDNLGGSVPPVATKFYDFIVYVHELEEVIALSFKSTGLKVARQLNGLITFRNAPLQAGIYSLTSGPETNSKGTFGNFTVKNAGWVHNEETFKKLTEMAEALKTKTIVIEREPGGDDDTFEPSQM